MWTVCGGRWVQRQFVPPVPGHYRGWAESYLEGGVPRDISIIAAADAAAADCSLAEWPAVRVPLHT